MCLLLISACFSCSCTERERQNQCATHNLRRDWAEWHTVCQHFAKCRVAFTTGRGGLYTSLSFCFVAVATNQQPIFCCFIMNVLQMTYRCLLQNSNFWCYSGYMEILFEIYASSTRDYEGKTGNLPIIPGRACILYCCIFAFLEPLCFLNRA